MEKRQPFKMNRILQIYNILQIFLNAFLFYKVSSHYIFNYLISKVNYLVSNFYKDMKKKNIFHIILFTQFDES